MGRINQSCPEFKIKNEPTLSFSDKLLYIISSCYFDQNLSIFYRLFFVLQRLCVCVCGGGKSQNLDYNIIAYVYHNSLTFNIFKSIINKSWKVLNIATVSMWS